MPSDQVSLHSQEDHPYPSNLLVSIKLTKYLEDFMNELSVMAPNASLYRAHYAF